MNDPSEQFAAFLAGQFHTELADTPTEPAAGLADADDLKAVRRPLPDLSQGRTSTAPFSLGAIFAAEIRRYFN